jgi:diadenosine tetraphosphatase ApaH/serine/threonine PP2A family protein phosphatase
MLCALLSDVHANLEALDAVLGDVDRRGIRDILFLGDAVGYGPDPNECVDLLAERCKVLLAGNHDRAAIGLQDVTYFNVYARNAIEWTMKILTERNRGIIGSWPFEEEMKDEDILLVHSTPKEPSEWHYLLTLWDAEINFQYFDNKFCFLGHSHQPFVIEKVPSGELVTHKDGTRIREGSRYIINIGSVGQPRDGDPRACYAIMNGAGIDIVRVSYDIASVQDKMKKEHLPQPLIERILAGK